MARSTGRKIIIIFIKNMGSQLLLIFIEKQMFWI